MKLLESPMAPNCRRVRIFLSEKGIEVPIEDVDIAHAENRKDAFLAKNPMGTVPVLQLDDGSYLAESMAICRYFEETQPEPNLMGRSPQERAEIEMWQRRMELELLLPIAQVFRQSHAFFKGRIEQVPEYGEACRRSSAKRLDWLDRELASRPFIAGDRYTVADITALCAIDFGRVSKIGISEEQKNLARWHGEVSSRESARA